MAGGRAHGVPFDATFMLLCLAMSFLMFSDVAQANGRGKLRQSDCRPKCTYRCSATSHKKPCMFFCQKCCVACLCVPRDTYGNKEQCPCYNNWKTQEGRPKCP
ncbi:hypothetical protein MLD38_034657 [Melastoma candidum]|uniref:Uncharacterized protein n=1 Tax=Melastoma candidum TaxID=119954 RepID=A0ACB9MB97_9MYRT|nr:hypothetical protein MLD38_034657 [Melastoma candidum]